MPVDMGEAVVKLTLDTSDFDAIWESKQKEVARRPNFAQLRDAQDSIMRANIDKATRSFGMGIRTKLTEAFSSIDSRIARAARGSATYGATMAGAAGFGVGAGAVKMASVASPLAEDTLSGSIKLTSAIIGRDFIPIIAELSALIQQAGVTWKNLDQEVKDNIVTMTKMVAVAGVAGLGIAGLTKALFFLSRNPLVMAGMGVAALAVGAYEATQKNQDRLNKIHDANVNMDKQGVLEDEVSKKLAGMDREKAKKAALDELAAARGDFAQKKAAHDQYADSYSPFKLIDFFRSDGGIGGASTRRTGIAEQRLREAEIRAEGFGNVDLIAGKPREGSRPLRGTEGPASFAGVSELNRQIQLAAGGSQLESATVREQKATNRKFDAVLAKFGIKSD